MCGPWNLCSVSLEVSYEGVRKKRSYKMENENLSTKSPSHTEITPEIKFSLSFLILPTQMQTNTCIFHKRHLNIRLYSATCFVLSGRWTAFHINSCRPTSFFLLFAHTVVYLIISFLMHIWMVAVFCNPKQISERHCTCSSCMSVGWLVDGEIVVQGADVF